MTIRAQRRRVPSGLDDRVREKLTTGLDWPFLEGFERTDAELREVWHEHRGSLLTAWLREKPGTRPAGWWMFDAPREPRRRVGGVGTPLKDAPLHFGIPSQFEDDYHFTNPPRYEAECDYLQRHNLLMAEESKPYES